VIDEGRIIRCRPLAREVAARAIEVGRASAPSRSCHCGSGGEGWLLVEARAQPEGLVAYYLERARGELRLVDGLVEALACEDTIQVMFGGERAGIEKLYEALAEALSGAARLERTVYPANDFALVDVLDPSVGKADALAFLCGPLGHRGGGDARDRRQLERPPDAGNRRPRAADGKRAGRADRARAAAPADERRGRRRARARDARHREQLVGGLSRVGLGAPAGAPRSASPTKMGGETDSRPPPNVPGALTSSSSKPSSWQPSSSPAYW
jgi:hypothetical protein